jgi:hypothetical protein
MANNHGPFELPGVFTPRPQYGRLQSSRDIFASTAPFATSSETSAQQMTDIDAHGTRKRSRYDANFHSQPSHTTTWADSSLSFLNTKSPPPLANDRYELAGGMDSSDNGFGKGRHMGDYDDYFQLEKQRGSWATPSVAPSRLQNCHTADHEIQPTPDSPIAKPWMFNQLISLVGGVAGKLVSFCSVPFRGFQAGGGQAYTFDGEIAAQLGLQDDFDQGMTGSIQQPPSGAYPEDSYGVLSVESVEQNERPRMPKRLKTGESWVVVDNEGGMESRPSTPRLLERKHARRSSIPRPMPRAGSTATGKRPSLIPVSRRSTMDRDSFQRASKAPTPTTPRCYSRQAYGSPVMFENKLKSSPLPPDSHRLLNKMKREEMEGDAQMRRMSSKMSDMLKEAMDALGSKVEIDYHEMDSGGMDDEYSQKTW